MKDVKFWTGKGWTALEVPVNSAASEVVTLDPTTQDLVVKGQIYDSTGSHVSGKIRPHFNVKDVDGGAVLSFVVPTTQDMTFLVKIVSDTEESENVEKVQAVSKGKKEAVKAVYKTGSGDRDSETEK